MPYDWHWACRVRRYVYLCCRMRQWHRRSRSLLLHRVLQFFLFCFKVSYQLFVASDDRDSHYFLCLTSSWVSSRIPGGFPPVGSFRANLTCWSLIQQMVKKGDESVFTRSAARSSAHHRLPLSLFLRRLHLRLQSSFRSSQSSGLSSQDMQSIQQMALPALQ
jgi:hypothetical protein